jgi:catalase
MPPDELARRISRLTGSLRKTPRDIQEKRVEHFTRADKDYGTGIAKGYGLI